MSDMLDVEDIRALLPHRYPMLLVDRILELSPGQHAVGLKNVSANEPFFMGHFPGQAIMPGVLILESMAQVVGVMMLSEPQYMGMLPIFAGVDKVRFRRPVVPGDALRIESQVKWVRGLLGHASATAKVGEEVACTCEMSFALRAPDGTSDIRARMQRLMEQNKENHVKVEQSASEPHQKGHGDGAS